MICFVSNARLVGVVLNKMCCSRARHVQLSSIAVDDGPVEEPVIGVLQVSRRVRTPRNPSYGHLSCSRMRNGSHHWHAPNEANA